jgi:DNA-3-methyladenine glycosylase
VPSRRRLTLAFYRRDAAVVARDLLGRDLCRRIEPRRVLRARIVEVEVYDGFDDRASHAHRGPTRRNAPMFRAGGIAYVYLIYGMHHCLNLVTGDRDRPSAILIRAAESPGPDLSASGPGRLCRAFRIDRELDGESLRGPDLWLEEGDPVTPDTIRATPRIGVDYAGACARKPLRFIVRGHRAVSGPAHLRS